MREILLTQGKKTIVDDEDYEKLNCYKWCAHKMDKHIYAAHSFRIENKWKQIPITHIILNVPKGMIVDHINGNTLDNRKYNLRICTVSVNGQNRHNINGKSQYLGVYWFQQYEKWGARITKDKERYFLGYFENEVEAALAYNKTAIDLYDKPKLNTIKHEEN